MPMGFISIPATFQAVINYILHNLLNNRVFIYINDILIYPKTLKKCNRLILDSFTRLRQNKLAITP